MLGTNVVLLPGEYREAIQLLPVWTPASIHILEVESPPLFTPIVQSRASRGAQRGMARRGRVWEPPWEVVTPPPESVFVPDPYREHRKKQPANRRKARVYDAPLPQTTPVPPPLVRQPRRVPPRPARGGVTFSQFPTYVSLVPATFTFTAQPLSPQVTTVATEVIPRRNSIQPRPRHTKIWAPPASTEAFTLPEATRKPVMPPRRQRRAQGAPFYPAVPPAESNLVPATFTFTASVLVPQVVAIGTEVTPRKRVQPPFPRHTKVWLAPTPDQPVAPPQAIRRNLIPPRPKRRAGGNIPVPRVTVDLVPATFTFTASPLAPQVTTIATQAIPRRRITPPFPRERRITTAPTPVVIELTEVTGRNPRTVQRVRRAQVWDAPPSLLEAPLPPTSPQYRRRVPPRDRGIHAVNFVGRDVLPSDLVPVTFTFTASVLVPTVTEPAPSQRRKQQILPRRRQIIMPPPLEAQDTPIIDVRRRLRPPLRSRVRVAYTPPRPQATVVDLVPAVFTFTAQELAPQVSPVPEVVRGRRWIQQRRAHIRIAEVTPSLAPPPGTVNLVPAVFHFEAMPLLDAVNCIEVTFEDGEATVTWEDGTATTSCSEGTATITFEEGCED